MTYPYSFLAPSPREVPWPIQLQVLFGGFYNQFGWLFFGFGLIFFWIFGLNTFVTAPAFMINETVIAPGQISDIQETGSAENDTPVYANHYIFRVEREEKEYRGVSYTTGQQFSVGETVTIEYVADSPERSRIQGARSGEFSPLALCVVSIFPGIGLAFITAGLRHGLRGRRLLHLGQLTRGKLIGKEPTGTRINEQTVYKLTFEFTAADGQRYEAVAKSHQTYILEDEDEEQLVYDPANPANAVLLDNLPGFPDIDDMGQLHVARPTVGLLVLVLPALTVLLHGAILLNVIL